MSNDHAAIVGILNGVNIIFSALIRELDSNKLVNKQRFADQLEAGAKEAAATAKGAAAQVQRLDLLMMENLAKLLRDPSAPPTWIPTVIEGGLSDEPNQDGSS